MGACPRVADWDSDGRKDLVVGEAHGCVRIYLNTGTDASPLFSGYSLLKVGEVDFNCSLFATPYVVDWNNDGRKDLICGCVEGRIYLLINEGTDASPLFPSASFIQSGGGDLWTGIRNAPVAADWNRDGKKDLLVGAWHGQIEYFENRGSDASPAFAGSNFLTVEGMQRLDVGEYSRFDLVDWNGDGELDIVCGNQDGYVIYFRAVGPLSSDVNFISAAAGGSIEFALNAGLGFAERNYFLMGTAAGTEPGTPLPGGARLPLNWGAVSWYIFYHYNTDPLPGFRGVLDESGRAQAGLHAAWLPLPPGTLLHFAYTTEWPYDFQSKPLAVEVIE